MWGVIYGSRAFLPHLKQRSESWLVNISSIYGLVPAAGSGPYNISRYAVYGLNETLMNELKNTSVKLLSVHPGGIQTNIANNAIGVDEASRKAFNSLLRTTAPDAAKAIIKAARKGKNRVYIGSDAKFLHWMKRLCPDFAISLIDRLAGKALGSK